MGSYSRRTQFRSPRIRPGLSERPRRVDFLSKMDKLLVQFLVLFRGAGGVGGGGGGRRGVSPH